jgi:hypothetical protein
MPIQTTYLDQAPLPFAGVIAESETEPPVTAINTEVSAEVPFGYAVARDNTAPYDVNGNGAKLPAGGADVLLGIVRHSHAYSNSPSGDLGTVGLKPGAVMSVQRKGRIWAVCEDGCSPGARLFVRHTVAGAGKGTLRATDAGGGTCIDATTKAEWQTKAAALGVAILEIDFTNE